MRINITNKAGINVDENFEITFRDAGNISIKINEYLHNSNQESGTTAAGVYAVYLIGQVFQHIFSNLIIKENPDIFTNTKNFADKTIGKIETQKIIDTFANSFPPKGNHLEELLVLRLTNENPACLPYRVIFEETDLLEETAYMEMMNISYNYLKNIPGPGEEGLNIIDFLKAPGKAHPDSLHDQLSYISKNWKLLLGDKFQFLLRGLDFLKEENKPHFPAGPGPVEVYTYDYSEGSPEGFSLDSNWMPNVVMIAKSTLVWLDQLSKQYNTSITRLDQIPDNELDTISSRGFSALWLIGLWERSSASKQIKRTCGNPEAESSAYSLKRYEIADELGGWESLNNLKHRCAERGIRLASDMVPNHTGIDSDWISEHPDWFLQLPYSPYPNYSFDGQNLSPNPNMGIYIEDHYYDQTDAAVTFKTVDFNTGEERHIYHGNDGTSMPWNDTAQLNYLNPETREAIIQTILHVARNFPVIRFDAAMTLAKKHIQRLWFPEPGSGGDIPTRSERGLSRSDFNKSMPIEFWREVVDRIKEEAPETLLLAEAFWMMEGYFVKNLGMHRVYNSAFMNMLKKEENHKYKDTIKNTLIFDPEILKRFVNFMNNPDEDTAAEQFGMGDKYFGICTMLATMPGLPMFGHGQIEGFKEKYGMEYRKAYHNEIPDINFVNRHKKEIFPLIKKRYLFSESKNFQLYDLYNQEGHTNENVFAWSNSTENECVIVFYNNTFNSAAGWIHKAASKLNQSNTNIGNALNLKNSSDYYCIFKEQRSNLFYIRSSQSIINSGLFLHLNGYESRVFIDFNEVYDESGKWEFLSAELNGKGTSNIDRKLRQLTLRKASKQLEDLFHNDFTFGIQKLILKEKDHSADFINLFRKKYLNFLSKLPTNTYIDEQSIKQVELLFLDLLKTIESFGILENREETKNSLWIKYIYRGLGMMPEAWTLLLAWIILFPLSKIFNEKSNSLLNVNLIEFLEDLNIDEALKTSFTSAGIEQIHLHELLKLALIIPAHRKWGFEDNNDRNSPLKVLEEYLNIPLISNFIGRNYHQKIEWFKREPFQLLVWWVFTLNTLKIINKDMNFENINDIFNVITMWLDAEENSECQIDLLFESIRNI
jgi:Alpha amylase, catalytic domain